MDKHAAFEQVHTLMERALILLNEWRKAYESHRPEWAAPAGFDRIAEGYHVLRMELLNAARLPKFGHPHVQQVYEILADGDLIQPASEHWEGFAARVVAARVIRPALAEERARIADQLERSLGLAGPLIADHVRDDEWPPCAQDQP